ncbi:MAG: hypothetical protein ACO3AD_20645, partial [Burkholderiaceae bacterium]
AAEWDPKKDTNTFESDFENQEVDTDVTTTGGGWMRERVITTKVTTVTGLKDFYTYGLRADRPVTVAPVAGADKPSVNIVTPGKLFLQGSISFGSAPGDADTAVKRSLVSAGELTASSGVLLSGTMPSIRAHSGVTLTVTSPVGPLDIEAWGDVGIRNLAGTGPDSDFELKIGSIIAARPSDALQPAVGDNIDLVYDVSVQSARGMESFSPSDTQPSITQPSIIGKQVTLDGGAGGVRVNLDSNGMGGGVSARASDLVDIKETDGDLRLTAPSGWTGASIASSAGDVMLTALAGAILDAVDEIGREAITASQLDVLRASGFTDEEFQSAGVGSRAAAQAWVAYQPASDLLAMLAPHAGATASAAGGERLNVQAANVELRSGDPSAPSPAGVKYGLGEASGQVTITDPMNFAALTPEQGTLLSRARPSDVIDLRFEHYVYLGPNAKIDVSTAGRFSDTALWRKVTANDAVPGNVPILRSTAGLVQVVSGQWVEDGRKLLSVTLRAGDDLDVQASGKVDAHTSGVAVLSAQGNLSVDARSGGTTLLQAGGNLTVDVQTAAVAVFDFAAGGSLTGRAITGGEGQFKAGADLNLTTQTGAKVRFDAAGDMVVGARAGGEGRFTAGGDMTVAASLGGRGEFDAVGDLLIDRSASQPGIQSLVGVSAGGALSMRAGGVISARSDLLNDDGESASDTGETVSLLPPEQ